jgi:ribosomal protein S18 acetylase RimI-like enzyme
MRILETRIQAAIRADATRSRDVERIGPFVATFSRSTDNPYLNYAIPEPAAQPSPEDVEALAAAYRERGKKPRLEYLPKLAPWVEPVLVEHGFAVERRLPLMLAVDSADVVEPDGIEIVGAATPDEIRAAGTAQNEAYGEPGPSDDAWVAGAAKGIAAGGAVVLARDAATGEPAGGGACTAPHDGASELTSIGVRPAYRRRGIAAAMTAWLAREMDARGVRTVFLMAEDEQTARIYERVGFVWIGEVLIATAA